MGFNLKEKFSKLSKKSIIISSIVTVLVICAIAGAVGGYKYKVAKEKQQAQEAHSKIRVKANGEPLKPSEYNIGTEYDQAMKGKKPVLVLFYADWCHYCIRFMPIYQALSEKYNADMEFSKVNVEDKKYEKLVREIGITGFPTVFIIDPKYDNRVLLSNAYLGNIETVSKELDRYIRIRKILDSKK